MSLIFLQEFEFATYMYYLSDYYTHHDTKVKYYYFKPLYG